MSRSRIKSPAPPKLPEGEALIKSILQKSLYGYVEITKVLDEDQHIVEGYATSDAIDFEDEVVDPGGVRDALPDYMEWGNLREMHQLSAVGTVIKAELINGDVILPNGKVISNPLYIVARVVDDKAWDKVCNRVYKGFSLGGRALRAEHAVVNGKKVVKITALRITEISLVDRPANPDAQIVMWKGVTNMPDTEPVITETTAPQATEGSAPVDQSSAPQVAPTGAPEAWSAVESLAKAAKSKGKVKNAIMALQDCRNDMELSGNTDGADYISGAIKLAAMAMADQGVDMAGGDGDGDPIEQDQQGAAPEESGATGSNPPPKEEGAGETGATEGEGESKDKEKEGERYKAARATLGEVARSTLAKLATGDPLAARALSVLDGKTEPAPAAPAPALDIEALATRVSAEIAKAVSAQIAPFAERQDMLAKAIAALPTPGGPRQRLIPAEKPAPAQMGQSEPALPGADVIEKVYRDAISATNDPAVKQALQQDLAKTLYLRGHSGQ